jgi:hypothetical protein
MVHFISWLSDLMLELRKWIIFMVLLPLGTQWQKANMHRSTGEQAGSSGRRCAGPRGHTPRLTHCPWDFWARLNPGIAAASGACGHTRRQPGRGGRVLSPHPAPGLASSFPRLPRWRARAPPLARARWVRMAGRRAEHCLSRAPSSCRSRQRDRWLGWPESPGGGPAPTPPPPLRQAGPGCLPRPRRFLPPSVAVALAPGGACPCPAPDSAPHCSASGTWRRWKVESDPGPHPQGGFRWRRGLLGPWGVP